MAAEKALKDKIKIRYNKTKHRLEERIILFIKDQVMQSEKIDAEIKYYNV